MADEPSKPITPFAAAVTELRPLNPGPLRPDSEERDRVTLESSSSSEALAADADRHVEVGDVLAGKYRLTGTLGGGGMGTVFRGEHLSLRVPIAVKVMKRILTSDPEFVGRFEREAHAASVLSHPGVVRVLDFSLVPVPYIVMEYIAGESLGARLERLSQPPPLTEVKEILLQMFAALEAAHAAGIVHRDLKPDNIVLSLDGAKQQSIKIVDFGLARLEDTRDLGPRLTRADYVAGTPAYMSPEQCRSLSVGPAADLYAVGCILTELLQLRPPFVAGSSMEVMSAQMFLPPSPLERPPEAEPVPELLERLRLDLLGKLPQQRPESARQARERLLEAMDPELSETRLPHRKADMPLGSRDERAVSGYLSPSQRPGASTPLAQPVAIQLLPLGGATGIDGACVTALGIQGLQVTRRASAGTLDGGEASPIVLLDVGADVSLAATAMAEVRAALPSALLVVCASGLDTTTMNRLIEASAADIVTYPIDPSTLARKLKRLVRRRVAQ